MVSQIQCAAAGMTSSASQFLWAISLLSPVNTSLIFACLLTPAGGRFPFVPSIGCLLPGMSSGELEAPPSLCVLCISDREHRQSPDTSLLLFHGAWQHDEQSSDAPPAPWSQVSIPACHNVCHTLLLVQVPSKLLTSTLREEAMWVRKDGAEVHPLGAASCVPPLASLCAYTRNSILIILGVNMSCVLLNELVTRSIFTWRISEKKASDSKRKHQSYFGGKLLEVLYNMSQLTSSLCLPCREDIIGLGFLYLLWI